MDVEETSEKHMRRARPVSKVERPVKLEKPNVPDRRRHNEARPTREKGERSPERPMREKGERSPERHPRRRPDDHRRDVDRVRQTDGRMPERQSEHARQDRRKPILQKDELTRDLRKAKKPLESVRVKKEKVSPCSSETPYIANWLPKCQLLSYSIVAC